VNDPARVAATGRCENLARLAALPGVRAPRARCIARRDLQRGAPAAAVQAAGLDFPLLLRSPGYHTGEHFARVDRAADLPAALDGVRAGSLREAGTLLGDRDAGLFTHAVALANWHDTHTHCPVDGTPTIVDPGGHSTRCPKDGTEHFPRTDPAVIMLVTDPDDRCLLARNAAWPGRRVSILAGFVDPGESAEQAVIREVAEETSITVTNVRYLGSQPWPMPRSLMLGFRADAPAGQAITVDHTELAEAYWFSRDELLAAVKAREIALPPPVSIARHIIEHWFGGPLPSTWGETLPPRR